MMDVSSGIPGTLGLIFGIIAGVILVAAWVILAGSRFIQGGVVERPERVPQLYGYTVCLIALMWALTSVLSIVGNALSLSARSCGPAPSTDGKRPSHHSKHSARPTIGPDSSVHPTQVRQSSTPCRRRSCGVATRHCAVIASTVRATKRGAISSLGRCRC